MHEIDVQTINLPQGQPRKTQYVYILEFRVVTFDTTYSQMYNRGSYLTCPAHGFSMGTLLCSTSLSMEPLPHKKTDCLSQIFVCYTLQVHRFLLLDGACSLQVIHTEALFGLYPVQITQSSDLDSYCGLHDAILDKKDVTCLESANCIMCRSNFYNFHNIFKNTAPTKNLS